MPSTPPPSFTPSHASSSSKRHKSRSAEKEKEKEKGNDRDIDKEHDHHHLHTKQRDDHDDIFSVNSRSTNSSSATDNSNVSTTTIDTLRLMSGNGVRRSKCRAEFVEDLAKTGGLALVLGKGIAEKLNIIAGKDGIAFFRKFIREIPFEAGLKSEEDKRELQRKLSNPVVFAVRVIDAGRKVLDYYMTWRGKIARAKDIKGSERRTGLLDEDFRRVARTIDKEYKRSSHDDSHSHKSTKSKKNPSSPSIVVSPPDPAPDDTQLPGTPTGKRTSSANDSVISLPFLGTVRNVPISYRLPLRVTNPDRNSLVDPSVGESPVTQTAPKNSSLETLVEAAEPVESGPGDPERQASFDTLVQASDADQKLAPKKEKRRKSYAESISSTGSRSSRSSRRTHKRHDRSRSRKTSPVRNHHESSSRSKSERKEHGHSSSSRHKDGDEDDNSRSTRKRHSTTRHRDEKREKDEDDRSSHKSSRKHSEKPLESNITLVILDPEEVDREAAREAAKHVKKETLTRTGSAAWHKVVQPRRLTKPTPTTVTPWTGPLARESDGIKNINPKRGQNYDSDESDEWIDIPQIVSKTGSFVASPPSSDYSSDDDDPSPPSSMGDGRSPDFPIYRQHSNPLSPPANSYNLLPPPVNPYRHASPQTMPYQLSSPPPPTIPFGFVSPTPSAHTPGIIPSTHFSPAGSNASLHAYHNPGYIPSPYHSPNHSLHHTYPLASIHSISDSVSAATHAAAMTHGSASPYLYSTPRPAHSPYVPAWISPASSMSVSLPGTMTPTSPGSTAMLHSGGYTPTFGGGQVY